MRRNTSLRERKHLVENYSYMHASSEIIFLSRRIVFQMCQRKRLKTSCLFALIYIEGERK